MTMTPLDYEQSKAIEARIKKWLPTLPEWERLQLTFDILATLKRVRLQMDGKPRHEVTVRQLLGLLNELTLDDVLVPNLVRNLAIERGGQYIGYINLLKDFQEVNFNE